MRSILKIIFKKLPVQSCESWNICFIVDPDDVVVQGYIFDDDSCRWETSRDYGTLSFSGCFWRCTLRFVVLPRRGTSKPHILHFADTVDDFSNYFHTLDLLNVWKKKKSMVKQSETYSWASNNCNKTASKNGCAEWYTENLRYSNCRLNVTKFFVQRNKN